MIVFDSSLGHHHNSIRKFSKRWFGPYEVRKVFDNGTYQLCELDEIVIRVPVVRKRVQILKKRSDDEPYVSFDNTDTKEQSNKSYEGSESNESGLELIIDIGEETEDTTNEGE